MTSAFALDAIIRGLRLKPRLSVAEWADTHRVLSSLGSAEPGRWKTARTPYLREIMDQLSETSPARLVVFMKPSQIGGTEVGSNWLGYIMAHAGGPVAVVMPTEKSLADWMTQKFSPMVDETPQLQAVIARRNNSEGNNSATRKRFRGGVLYAKTAGSTAELKSTSLRYALADEIDEYPRDGAQGSVLGLLDIRLTTYHDAKLYVPSSPTIKDASAIEELFEKGDQRRYHVPCPHCAHLQVLQWGQLRWQYAADTRRIQRAAYVCAECGAEIEEHHKLAMLAEHGRGGAARWVPGVPGAAYPSYHLNALYAPLGLGKSWRDLAQEWIDAQDDRQRLVVFINTRLAESWADKGDIKSESVAQRAEPYPLRTVPEGCCVLTCGVDVQDDRLELQVLGFGRQRIWSLDYHVLPGNPADEGLWQRLAEYVNAFEIFNAHQRALRIEALGIDSGFNTHAVYHFVRQRLVRRALPIKGVPGSARPILGRPSLQDVNWRGVVAKKGIALYAVGADTAKHHLYNLLHLDADKPASERRLHFPQAYEKSYFDQLVAEVYNPRKQRWELRKGRRNEALDTWIYAFAASHHPELYVHKWRDADWQRRLRLLEPGDDTPAPADAVPAAAPAAPAPPQGRRPASTPVDRPRFKATKW